MWARPGDRAITCAYVPWGELGYMVTPNVGDTGKSHLAVCQRGEWILEDSHRF